jgi:hypothetical protein
VAKAASHKDAIQVSGISICLLVKFIIAIVELTLYGWMVAFHVPPHRNFYATLLSAFRI